MKIQQISVSGLFGIFNHVIPLNVDERITIIHGPNGFGKTAMLTLLNGFFNSQYSVFQSIPFSSFRVEFDNNSSIEIVKISNGSENPKKRNQITFDFCTPDSKIVSFTPKSIKDNSKKFSIDTLDEDEIVPGLRRFGARTWRYLPTNETLSLEEVMERFEDFPQIRKLRGEPDWLESLKSSIYVRLIESQRLLNIIPKLPSKLSPDRPLTLPTVSAYSDELAQIMRDKFTDYGEMAQSLDRTFPTRLINQQPSSDLTNEQLRDQLNELEATRSRLMEIGLLDEDEDSDSQIQPQSIDERTKNMLSVYVEDVEKKLSVFSEIESKINLLRRIVNNKFAYSYKEMNFNKEKGFVFRTLYHPSSSDRDTLSPMDLSSGEQHELVLLYELLFKVKPNSLVLIDEPELSLHVGWQAQFLEDLREITKLADLDVLMATHSPDIIQGQWDLTVNLKGPEK